MKGLRFYGYHGVLEAEKTLGQKFILHIVLYLDLQEAGLTDDVNATVSYAEVYEVVKAHVEDQRYDLLEALAEQIAKKILASFHRVQSVEVTVEKPEAPVPGIYDAFAVEIRRDR